MTVATKPNGDNVFGPAVVVADSVTSRRSDPVLAFDSTGNHLYLAWLGFSGGFVGPLLWPAVIVHAILTLLLANSSFRKTI